MIEGIEPLYQRIADAITSALPETWHRAWMDAIYYPDNMLYHSSYQATESGECDGIETTRDARRAFDEMRVLFVNTGKVPWGRARFEILSTGKFNLQLSYDDCDERGFARFDEAAEREWHRQVLAGVATSLLGAKPGPSSGG